jgi:hypothetical protein
LCASSPRPAPLSAGNDTDESWAQQTTRTPPHKAARVRDNQRRSRARHREYVDALRARIARHEREGAQASAELQRAARAVARENVALRGLLLARGVGEEALQRYVKTVAAASRETAVALGGDEPEGGVAGRLVMMLAGMERRRERADGGGEVPAADAPRPLASGEVPGLMQLSPPLVKAHPAAPRLTRERTTDQPELVRGRPTLPELGLALGAKRYDAIRDCLERPKALAPDDITN